MEKNKKRMENLNDYRLLVLLDKLKKEEHITLKERLIRWIAIRVIPEDSRAYLEAADACKDDVLVKKVGIGDIRITPKGREQIPVLWRTSVYGNILNNKLISYASIILSVLSAIMSIAAYCKD